MECYSAHGICTPFLIKARLLTFNFYVTEYTCLHQSAESKRSNCSFLWFYSGLKEFSLFCSFVSFSWLHRYCFTARIAVPSYRSTHNYHLVQIIVLLARAHFFPSNHFRRLLLLAISTFPLPTFLPK
ncbi:hypothetical protein VCUG_01950 [Vavraia culicis subsp. floridensis]|uniref:Uncharacterized protein n=1 Tax=Vavraia culicis (isolate floridensis) TaxID=948595 RepID=L2GT74_VAVCU|nr:uncharacterized protein VCUG_01950 [Vavraia culicis subsp. floridensis]ELA46572.1 hypothetical protein VCUG_01950 [Vavraia culicis subsp. floridensis]